MTEAVFPSDALLEQAPDAFIFADTATFNAQKALRERLAELEKKQPQR